MRRAAAVAAIIVALLLTSFTATNADFVPVTLFDLVILAIMLVVSWTWLSDERAWWSPRERIGIWVLCLLWCALVIRYLLAWREPYLSPGLTCLEFSATIARFECLTGLDFSQNYGLRQLITHVAAFALFAVTVVGTRTRRLGSWWPALLVPALVWSGYTALAVMGVVDDTLTGSAWITGLTPKLSSSTAVTANPGWLWPLLGPAAAILLALSLRPGRQAIRIAWLVTATLPMLAVFASGQRGGYLLMAVLVAVYGAILIGSKLTRRWRLAIVPGAIIAIGAGMYALLTSPLYPQLTSYLGMRFRKDPVSLSEIRLEMWRHGMDKFLDHPWTGTGYASWMHLGNEPRFTLPTAHNFWVQTLVEHGLLIAIPTFALLLYLLWSITCQRGLPLWLRAAGILVSVSLVATSVVQELDHVNAIYYQLAVAVGILYGLATSLPIDAVRSPRRRKRWAIVGAAACVVVVTWGALQFSWGGYGFGGRGDPLVRTFRPTGRLMAFGDRSGRLYSVGNVSQSVPVGDFGASKHGVVLTNGAKQWGRAFAFEARKSWFRRQMVSSFRVTQPFFQTNLAIHAAKDVHGWEGVGWRRIAERWCMTECKLLVQALPACDGSQSLVIGAPRPDVEATTPLVVVVRATAVMARADAKTNRHGDLNVEPLEPWQTVVLDDPQTKASVALPPLGQAWGWKIVVTADRGFQPYQDRKHGDTRILGAKLFDLTCQSPPAG